MAIAVVLNGVSSSGKTTLARAFQEIAPQVFLNFSIDTVLYALPPSAIERMAGGGDRSALHLPELVRAFYACVRQLLQLGHDLVVDHAVTARYHAELLLDAVESHQALLIGLDCPLHYLRARESSRADRRIGLAEDQQKTIHSQLEYDLLIDTSATRPEAAARQILNALKQESFGAVDRTRARLKA